MCKATAHPRRPRPQVWYVVESGQSSRGHSDCLSLFCSFFLPIDIDLFGACFVEFFQTRSLRGKLFNSSFNSDIQLSVSSSVSVFCICLCVCRCVEGNIMPKIGTLFCFVHIKKRSLLTPCVFLIRIIYNLSSGQLQMNRSPLWKMPLHFLTHLQTDVSFLSFCVPP